MINNVEPEYWQFMGGLNTELAASVLAPGMAIAASNYEPAVGGTGYRRMDGYERFDGRLSPSAQLYWLLPATITGVITVGATVTGNTSGATGYVLQVNAQELVITKLVGAFVAAEDVKIGGLTVATTTDVASANAASTPVAGAAYTALAANAYRADIGAVPGSGPLRGVWRLKGVTYALRDNAGGTACVMHKSTASGWSAVAFTEELSFTAGTSAYAEAATVTQGGVSATVARVVLQSGSWGAGTAAGRLIITGRSGGNFAAGAIAGGGAATASGIQSAITLLPGGRFKFVNHNFTGSADTLRMYGCDGVNRAFEFDGTVLTPIATGMAADKPSFIAAHKKHLFLAFRGSLQHSSIGAPYQWSVATGAAELGIGEDITGLLSTSGDASGGAMLIGGKRQVHVLYGSSAADWKLDGVAPEQGACAHTLQNLGTPRYLSDFGVTSVAATAAYGNFAYATITSAVQRFITGRKGMAVDSCLWRGRNQYRLFFSDGSGLIIGIDGKRVSCMPFLYPNAPACVYAGFDDDGTERLFFGAASGGYVYEAERGTSFDGLALEAWLALAFWDSRAPSMRKRYRRAVIETTAEGYSTLAMSHRLDFESDEIAQSEAQTLPALAPGGAWDTITWDQFFWDSKSTNDVALKVDGTGERLSLFFYANSDATRAHSLKSALIHYTPRRLTR